MKKKLFLIELFAVVLLLSILGVVMIPKFLDSQDGALVAQAKYELHLIGKGMKFYNQDHGRFPNRNGMMTNPRLYNELIRGNYVDPERLKDPFLGPNDVTNDGDPSIYFWADMRFDGHKYQHYNSTTNQYRGALPGSYIYNLGSTGPDKVINLDNPPYNYYGRSTITTSVQSSQPIVSASRNGRTVYISAGSLALSPQSIESLTRANFTNIKILEPIQETVINRPIIQSQPMGLSSRGIMSTQNGNPFHIFIDYDPSNGINSIGDIHHLGPE